MIDLYVNINITHWERNQVDYLQKESKVTA